MGRQKGRPFSFVLQVLSKGMHRHVLPFARQGQTIGLLGGSFDPAHEGHVHVTQSALRTFGLDRIWWVVSPGNPLKENGPAPHGDRIIFARDLVRHPKVDVTDVEARLGTYYTAETLSQLMRIYPKIRFTWVMGEDNLAQFHLWKDWEWIGQNIRIGVISRPNAGNPVLNSPFARKFRNQRLPSVRSRSLAHLPAPAWCFVNGPLHPQSSTLLRAGGVWPIQ